ncbi:hypothetical protein [Thermodesulfitimonas sp.]
MLRIDVACLHYRELNRRIREAIAAGEKEFLLVNVNGHRYIGAGLQSPVCITIEGVPGNDLACFMDGPVITVKGNAQDGVGNTMNGGVVVIHGDAGDVCGYGMRGGKLFIKGNVGYRTGIHMKAYFDKVPVVVVGGTTGDFLGEYMAGGILVILGLGREDGEPLTGDYTGTGMHGGTIFLRGTVEEFFLGKEVQPFPPNETDWGLLRQIVMEFCGYFGYDPEAVLGAEFTKLVPVSYRPYGRLYAP